MRIDPKLLIKAMAPRIAAKALKTFDRATTVVISVTWAGAILMAMFAIYTASVAVSARHAAEDARAAEPSLPTIVHSGIDLRQAQAMVERLQHRFPDIKFNLQSNQNLGVAAVDGSQFRQWLTALSYIDTIAPQYHWSIQQFCVGKCPNNELMHANLVGETLSYQMPQL